MASYDPLSAAELTDPYPTWAEARATCPVFQSQSNHLWFITRYTDVMGAVRDPATFSSAFAGRSFVDDFPAARLGELDALMAAGFPDTSRFLVTTDSPDHTKRRRLSQVAFTPGRVNDLEPVIAGIAERLCANLQATSAADLLGAFCYPLTTEVIAAIIGLDADLVPQMRQVSEDLLVLSAPRGRELTDAECDDVLARVGRISGLHGRLATLVAERRLDPRDDVLTGLLEAKLEDLPMLDEADVIALVFELILAGTDTTANLIAHAVVHATRSPDLWESLREDPGLATAVVEEALRIRGSSKGLFRLTTTDVDIDGATIPAGSMVQLLYGSANHDESVFPDPDVFLLDRPGIKRHIAFGFGTHFCLGAPLARLETRVALQTLSAHFPHMRVDAGAELSYLPSLTTHTLAALRVLQG